MIKELLREIGVTTKLSAVVAFLWVSLGTIFPIAIMIRYVDDFPVLWKNHPSLFSAFVLTGMVEFSIIAVLIFTAIKLERKKEEIKKHDEQLSQTVAARTAELQAAIKNLEVLASTDHLTKLANRRFLKSTIRDEFVRFTRSKREFSVIMLDVDHFKIINDTYGHPMGDRVLATIANVMRPIIRDIDVCGRYGGEEFLVVLPETNLQMATEISDRIRQEIEKINIDGITCTVSLGVASSYGEKSESSLMESVDKALYAAKRSGRNTTRVVKQDIMCVDCIGQGKCRFTDQEYVAVDCRE